MQDGAGNLLNGLTILDRGYTGHEHLQSVGLIHMNGRLYDPKLHRFLQPDNYVQDPSNTQSFNRYGYCWNNPLRYTDPNGEWIWIVIGAVVGGTINWIAHGAQLNMEGLKAFGIGAGAGALAGLIGPAAFTAFGGGAAGAGGFIAGAASGAVATSASQAFLTVGNHVAFGDPLMSGKEFIMGVAFGAALGGSINGISALRNGNTFWRGIDVTPKVNPISISPTGLAKTGEAQIKADVKIANTTQTSTAPTTQANTATAINKELGMVDVSKNPDFGIKEYYPANNGAMQGTTQPTTLNAGTQIDRFGSESGNYFSPKGTPLELRALSPGNNGIYNTYEVLKPFQVQSSIISPAFNQLGTGTQYLAPANAKYLQEFGYIIKR